MFDVRLMYLILLALVFMMLILQAKAHFSLLSQKDPQQVTNHVVQCVLYISNIQTLIISIIIYYSACKLWPGLC